MDVAAKLADTVDAELDRLISRRASQDRRPDPDKQEELWKANVRRYTARRDEEMRAAPHGLLRQLEDAEGKDNAP